MAKDYLEEIYDWAFYNMEGCDEPEWSLFSGIADTIAEYWRKTGKYKSDLVAGSNSEYDEFIAY